MRIHKPVKFSFCGLRRALIGSCWILFGEYVMFNEEARKTFNPTHVYPGVAFFLQNLFIFLSSLVFKVIPNPEPVLRIRDVYPGSVPSRIPDPNFFHPGSASKNFKYFN
jgi:hypothetical protein